MQLRFLGSILLGLMATTAFASPIENVNAIAKRDSSCTANSVAGSGQSNSQTCTDDGSGPVITTNGGTDSGLNGTTTTGPSSTAGSGQWPLMPNCFKVDQSKFIDCSNLQFKIEQAQATGQDDESDLAQAKSAGYPLIYNCFAKVVIDQGANAITQCSQAANPTQ